MSFVTRGLGRKGNEKENVSAFGFGRILGFAKYLKKQLGFEVDKTTEVIPVYKEHNITVIVQEKETKNV